MARRLPGSGPGNPSDRSGGSGDNQGRRPSTRRDAFDPDDIDDIDPEGPSAADLERFGDEFKTCPNCKSLVYDQAEICQACGHAFESQTTPTGTPIWAIIVGAALLAGFALLAVRIF